MPTNIHMHNAATYSHADILHMFLFAHTVCIYIFTCLHTFMHMHNTCTYVQTYTQMHICTHFHMSVHNHMTRHRFTLIIICLPLPGSALHSLAGLNFFSPQSHLSGLPIWYLPTVISMVHNGTMNWCSRGRREGVPSFSLPFTSPGVRLVICKRNVSLLPTARRL